MPQPEIQYWPEGHLGPFFAMLKSYLSLTLFSLISTFVAHAAETNTPTPKESNDMKPTLIEEDIVTLTTDDGVIVIKLDSVNCP